MQQEAFIVSGIPDESIVEVSKILGLNGALNCLALVHDSHLQMHFVNGLILVLTLTHD